MLAKTKHVGTMYKYSCTLVADYRMHDTLVGNYRKSVQ
jgi:hypothetical protein